MTNEERVLHIRAKIRELPKSERALWTKRVDKLVGDHVGETWAEQLMHGVKVRPREPGEGPGPVEPQDLDLVVANKLDKLYNTVADRVEEVAKKGLSAVESAGEALLLPLLAVAAVLFLWNQRK